MIDLKYSKFVYGFTLDATNNVLPIKLLLTEYTVYIPIGRYTGESLAVAIKAACEAEVPTETFTVTYDKVTRKFYILCSNGFEILFGSGVVTLNNCASVIGFNNTDHTVTLNPPLFDYESDFAAGYEYKPQFPLQSYNKLGTIKKLTDPVVNKTADGEIEMVYYGEENYIEFEIKYITDIHYPDGSLIRNNQNALSEVKSFLNYCILKNIVTFYPDENSDEVINIRLDKTSEDSTNGTAYRIEEEYNANMPNYYKTNKLTWRVMN